MSPDRSERAPARAETDLSMIRLEGPVGARRIAADYVADGLREAIQSGVLPDGAVLNQAALAARFGVSRVPVREAMRQLLAEGLIESEAHHLAVVRGLTLERLAEAYDNRALLEGYLVERAAPRLDAPLLAELTELERRMRTLADHVTWLSANADFHERINRQAGDATALELVAQLRSRAERYVRMWHGGADVHRPQEVGREHGEILACLAAGDAAAARLATERHIRRTGERLVAYGRGLQRRATTSTDVDDDTENTVALA